MAPYASPSSTNPKSMFSYTADFSRRIYTSGGACVKTGLSVYLAESENQNLYITTDQC